MTFRFLTAFLIACVVAAAPAAARDVRHPATGGPAFTFRMPDDWTMRSSPRGGLVVASADRYAAFSFSFADFTGTLDDLAVRAFKAANADPPRRGKAVTVSGYPGNAYISAMTNAAGVRMDMRMFALKLDDTHVATFTMLTMVGIPQPAMDQAVKVFLSVGVTPHP